MRNTKKQFFVLRSVDIDIPIEVKIEPVESNFYKDIQTLEENSKQTCRECEGHRNDHVDSMIYMLGGMKDELLKT